MQPRYDKDEVKFAVRANPHALFDRMGVRVRKSGGQLEANWCPAKDHKRRAMVFHPVKLQWKCHACDGAGDVFSLVAIAERLRMPQEFPAVLEWLARVYSVPPISADAGERDRMRAEWRRREQEAAQREAERVARLRATEHERAGRYWNRLLAEHAEGVRYLEKRGLGAARGLGLLRFDARRFGAPSLQLFASDGRVKNVIRRPLDPSDGDKPRGLYECTTPGTLVDPVTAITRGADVIIAEGFADSLTAKLAWREAYVLGAAGVGNVDKIAQVVAPRVAELGGRLIIAPHEDEDDVASEKVRKAVWLARAAGLRTSKGQIEVVVTGAQDLNDAWCAGWRPAA